MGRKSKFKPQEFEKLGNSNLSATLYASMLQSQAYKSLSNNAKVLYQYMKLQYYGAKPIEGQAQDCFYFNKAMYINDEEHPNSYGLYKNGAQFQRDLKQLVKHGFIEIVECGKTTRTKNIYKFSAKWQQYNGNFG